jgi:hypothetical protein
MYYGGGQALWRNTGLSSIPVDQNNPATANWQQLANAQLSTGAISAISVAITPANRLYYGTTDGHIFRMNNANTGNPSPTDITGSNFPNGAFVICIALDPTNGNDGIAVFGNYGVQSLFLTTNGGTSWAPVSGNLEEHPDGSGNGPSCRWATILHSGDTTLYLVGTSTGLYSTTKLNGMSTVWALEGAQTIGNNLVDMMDGRSSDWYVAVGTHGAGMFSGNFSFIAAPTAPTLIAPANNATNVATAPTMQWNASAGAANYHLQIAVNATFTSPIINDSVLTNTSYVPSGLTAKQTYYWRVGAVNQAGNGPYSPTWSFATGSSAVDETGSTPSEVSLDQNYPNPFSDATTFSFLTTNEGNVSLKVYDVLGKELATVIAGSLPAGNHTAQWDAGNLPHGVYFYRLTSGKYTITKQMMVLK